MVGILKCESDNQPEIVSLHQCLGNAEEEKMVLNEMYLKVQIPPL